MTWCSSSRSTLARVKAWYLAAPSLPPNQCCVFNQRYSVVFTCEQFKRRAQSYELIYQISLNVTLLKLRLLGGCRVNTEYVPKVSMCTSRTKIKAPTQIPIRRQHAAPHWMELRYFKHSDIGLQLIGCIYRHILCNAQTRTHDKLAMAVFIRNAYALVQLYTVIRGSLPGVCWLLVADALAPVWGQAISSH